MSTVRKTFALRYVGDRFKEARLPLDVMSDLPAFHDLLVAYAKDLWRSRNRSRKRLPKGFDSSLSFDLISIDRGSAVPQLAWSRDEAQHALPGFVDEIEDIVDRAYVSVLDLIRDAGIGKYPKSMSTDYIRALNKFGSNLRENERIEFVRGGEQNSGNVIYLDAHRRRELITNVRETYETLYEDIGTLKAIHIDGSIVVSTTKFGEIKIDVDKDRIKSEFDGNLGSDIQFSIIVELDSRDGFKSIINTLDIDIVDSDISEQFSRCKQRISDFLQLKSGWLDGIGATITEVAINTAERIITKRTYITKSLKIYPVDDGGILFELILSDWDYSIEIGPDGKIDAFGIELTGPKEQEVVEFPSDTTEFYNMIDGWLRGEP